jgi:protein-S-isoprenylcysteine O-methyltransferase Ste14
MQLVAWLGGGLFAAALADCAYMYLVGWGRTLPFTGSTAVAANTLLFAVFALHHSVFARDSVKQLVSLAVDRRWVRSVYVWTASGLLIVVLALWVQVGGDIYRFGGVVRLIMAAVQAAGLFVVARAVAAIDPLELAGIRLGRATPLTITGVYRFVRHPLYLGWVLMVFGTPHMTGDRLAFAVMTTLYLVIAIPWEERSLRAEFGDAYARYCESVRWRIVPYVY